MRHTYATTMNMAGLRPAHVVEQLGHPVQVLFERYAKWINGADSAREQKKLAEYTGVRFCHGSAMDFASKAKIDEKSRA